MAVKSPWYRDSLSFACSQCGRCCTGDPGYVWVTKKEIEALAEFRGLDLDQFGKRYLRRIGRRYSLTEKANNDCVFYDRGCTVYPARPKQCRTFPFWPENLKTRGELRLDRATSDAPSGAFKIFPKGDHARVDSDALYALWEVVYEFD